MITIENSIKSFYVILILAIAYMANDLSTVTEDQAQIETTTNFRSSDPTPIEMYQMIEKYADEFRIPRHIAYNIAYKETRYQGPFHWSYKPGLESYAGAVGPMQVMVSTAEFINHRSISKNRLKNDLEINVKTSMKLLRVLYDKYQNWGIACGAYNTGQPIINDYARFCISNKDYQKNWIYYQK